MKSFYSMNSPFGEPARPSVMIRKAKLRSMSFAAFSVARKNDLALISASSRMAKTATARLSTQTRRRTLPFNYWAMSAI